MIDALRLALMTGPTVYFLVLVAVGFVAFIMLVLRLTFIYIYEAARHGKAEAMDRLNRMVP